MPKGGVFFFWILLCTIFTPKQAIRIEKQFIYSATHRNAIHLKAIHRKSNKIACCFFFTNFTRLDINKKIAITFYFI